MKIASLFPVVLLISVFVAGCNDASNTSSQVSYKTQVAPVLQKHCIACHNPAGDGYKISGLNMESYTTLMSGTKFGPVIIPGNSLSSTLVRLINGKADPAITMPHGGLQLLTEQEVKTIADWIDQGAMDN